MNRRWQWRGAIRCHPHHCTDGSRRSAYDPDDVGVWMHEGVATVATVGSSWAVTAVVVFSAPQWVCTPSVVQPRT
eukprot:m.320316 g.320316  ORF g.320316 m.320316 type:complete len:75 (+) comp20317_c0_seq19:1817-2041(+)